MWDLSKHEKIEIETLSILNAEKALDNLVFCGGTMLRLCHELDRYSVDLDFWLLKGELKDLFENIKKPLDEHFVLRKSILSKDAILFEYKSPGYQRALKFEVKIPKGKVDYEKKIAYSKHHSVQVLLNAATLEQMMKDKVEAFIDRRAIRDAFDIEFLARRGIDLPDNKNNLEKAEKILKKFKAKDFTISLGSLLEFQKRHFYKQAKFSFLLSKIKEKLTI